MLSVILFVFSWTFIIPPNLLFASSSLFAETFKTPPVVEVAYVSVVLSFSALISAPVETVVSWYSTLPEIFILAPVAATVLRVFKLTRKFCVDPELALIFKSACFSVSFEKILDPQNFQI